jgi:glucuronate isomerase
MKTFITEDFLLQTDFARTLYYNYAKDLPIIDYHCHLSPELIADNHVFSTLTEIWLKGDHYKWRAMRTLGVSEKFITGNARDDEKFDQWAYTVPFTMRNPLYHWTHLELMRYFAVHDLLKPESAAAIYQRCNERLATPGYHTHSLLRKMNVEIICTTDDPCDSLEAHKRIAESNFNITVLPTFRPDKAYAIEDPKAYQVYLKRLSDVSGVDVKSFDGLMAALENRIEYFHSLGCRLSDHGLEQLYFPAQDNQHHAEQLFQKVFQGKALTLDEAHYFKYAVLLELGKLYHSRQWTQQFHLGALRNTNERMLRVLGPDTGFDSIGDFSQGASIAKFFNALDSSNQLAKTILYNLNPADNEVMATMIGNFNDGSAKGKMQFGSAWWFLDQKDGMEKQINALSNLGILSCFIGMLTDSRSFMSYPRHEYFRRILCNILGDDVKNGELPADEKWLGKLVSDICYHNAKAYFNFKQQPSQTSYAEKP